MECGDNAKLHQFFEKYNLNQEQVKVKYTSKAASYYRKKLAAIASKDEVLLK